jgi:hypothetical protein
MAVCKRSQCVTALRFAHKFEDTEVTACLPE